MYRFALIGCGRIAQRHAENIKKIGVLIAVCDIDLQKADAFAATHNAIAYYSIEDLLKKEKDFDVLTVCTPNGFHAEHSIKALQSGKNVLCEKPMCITSAAAWQMIETEKFSRKKLFVVKSARFNPLLKQLKTLIDNNELGRIYSFQLSCFWNRPKEYYTDWHGTLFPDGGSLYTQFSHYIDALIWLLGDIETVTGYCINAAHQEAIEFEDTGVASCILKNSVLGTINWSVNTYKKNSEIALTLIAEKGTICLGGEYLNEIKYSQTNAFMAPADVNPSNNYSSYNGSMSHHKEVYENLILALDDTTHKFTNIFDGLRTVEAIEKIYKSISVISTS